MFGGTAVKALYDTRIIRKNGKRKEDDDKLYLRSRSKVAKCNGEKGRRGEAFGQGASFCFSQDQPKYQNARNAR